MKKKVAFHNLGCKVNAYETEAMQEMLAGAGYELVPFAPGADIYIINTCTVTNIADRKSRQMLHRAKKMNPDAVVVAAGCYVQTETKKDPCIDLVVGNNKKIEIVSILEDYEKERQEGRKTAWSDEAVREDGEHVIDINHTADYENLRVNAPLSHTRAYIKVQDGCNQFCSYCIIPYARGRVRSRSMEDVLSEAAKVGDSGCREVVLTGIHLSSYGTDRQAGENLIQLVEAVGRIGTIRRIRLGSLEPRIITEDFVRRLYAVEAFCPHFHLSLQSGSDTVLKRMNRKYTSREYENACRIIRRFFPDAALTTDVIVGFPGESEEEFKQTCDFVRRIGFYQVHVFKYSPREGTTAAKMEGQIPEQEKTRRSHILQKIVDEQEQRYIRSLYGKKLEILLEEPWKEAEGGLFTGHSREYVRVAVPVKDGHPNQTVLIDFDKNIQIIH